MTRYGSRDVLQILDVKAHVLRYWEQLLPLVRSQRDESGHRVWTAAQVRMLQRLRHLVVDRGIAVHAAGEAILREAEAAPGNMKAGLEAVRHELVTTLQRARTQPARPAKAIDRFSRGGSSPGAEFGKDARDPDTGNPFSGARHRESIDHGNSFRASEFTTVLDPVAERFAVPPSAATRRAVTVERPLFRRARRIDPAAEGEGFANGEPGVVRIAYRHLFAHGGPLEPSSGEVSRLLRRILDFRTRGSDDTSPIIVCAPADSVAEYTTAFTGWNGPELSVAVVPYFSFGGNRWISPLGGVLAALGGDPEWQRIRSQYDASLAYLWAVESPDSPVSVPETISEIGSVVGRADADARIPSPQSGDQRVDRLVDQQVLHQEGIILTGHPGRHNVLVGESLLINLADRSLPERLLREGRWSIGPVVHHGSERADILQQRWRYDLWLRDLAWNRPAWIALPRSKRPALWRGYDWSLQIAAVWPEIRPKE